METRGDPCKPSIPEKVYRYSPVEANIKGGAPQADPKQTACAKTFGLFGKKGDAAAPDNNKAQDVVIEDQEPVDMSPPPYSDLGKKAKDVFGKGYHFGLIKLDVKTKSASGVEFSTGGHSNQETGKVFGSLETKYKVKEYGLTFSEKWNTDNTLGTEIAVQDQLLQGLKLSTNMSFAPQTGSKSAQLKSAFLHEMVALNADVDLKQDAPVINGSAVVGYQGWLAGYQAAFNADQKKLTKSNFALGFTSGDFTLHTNVDTISENPDSNDGQEFGGSIYQRVNPNLETAINLAWSSGSNNTKFGIGCKYDLDGDAAVRVKVDNSSQIGFGYQQSLRDGVTLTLSSLIDGKNFNQGGHKVGLALELEA